MKTIVSMITGLLLSTMLMGAGYTKVITGTVTSAEDGSNLPGVNVVEKGTSNGRVTDFNGQYSIAVQSEKAILVFTFIGMETQEVEVGQQNTINVQLVPANVSLDEVVVTGYGSQKISRTCSAVSQVRIRGNTNRKSERRDKRAAPAIYQSSGYMDYSYQPETNNESYASISENGFKDVMQNPLSTFSIDVDKASYANVRRFINMGQKPPADAIRVEEMINYFSYDYPQPEGEHPFTVSTEYSECPWNTAHKLLHIGLQGKSIDKENLPPSNLVFLVDVSGSMSSQNKLPLLKSAFKMLVKELRPEDRVAMVVYAGAAGCVLESTSGDEKATIIHALDKLNAGGSTAGGAGIQLAYKIATQNYVPEGNNRVILATDGDFNVGQSSDNDMEKLIEKEREKGIFITVLGFGMGNYKDSKMETIADKGNGNYAYIDNIQEANKVFVQEFGGTLFTIAKDVKFQIEFNPARVKGYRLVGYENRLLNDEDFNDDTKDAGEMGAGHTVTALYEIIPAGSDENIASIDPLKYQRVEKEDKPVLSNSTELMTVKLRYKAPKGKKSTLYELPVEGKEIKLEKTSNNFRFAASVAHYAMILRDSRYVQEGSLNDVLEMARKSRGEDPEGYRGEFIKMVNTSNSLMAGM